MSRFRLTIASLAVVLILASKAFGATPLTISTTSAPQGVQGVAYTSTLKATGGTPPYTWAYMGVSLPPGLKLSAAGVISGTPTTTGSFPFPFQVKDSAGQTASFAFQLAVAGPVSLPGFSSGVLPGAVTTQTYDMNELLAMGGFPPYTFSVAPGSALPPGLTLKASSATIGDISGSPTKAGSYSFSLQVKDSTGAIATRAYTMTVTNPPPTGGLTIATTPIPNAIAGTAYNTSLTASSGNPPYTWTFNGVTMPPGLKFSAAGVVSGTPTASGTYPFPVILTDSASHKVMYTFTLAIAPPTGPMAIRSFSNGIIPAGTVGVPYTVNLLATGGAVPLSWSIASGSALPPGLSISSAAANICLISGKATKAGTYSVNVQATDSAGNTTTRLYSFTINQ